MVLGLIGSEDEEDAVRVQEDLDDDIDSMYDVADAGDHEEPENADDEHSETGESTNEKTNVFQGKDFTGAGHLPTLLEQYTSQLYWSRTHPNFTGAGHLPNLLEQDTSQIYWSRTPPKFNGAGHLPNLLEQDTSQI
jgi:hypothetical protein